MVILWILGAMAIFLATYGVIHYLLPTWGTVLTNAIAGAAVLLDGMNALPWGTVLPPDRAAQVGFAIAGCNMIIRFFGTKKPVGSGA